jgi:hypothetical protein
MVRSGLRKVNEAFLAGAKVATSALTPGAIDYVVSSPANPRRQRLPNPCSLGPNLKRWFQSLSH